MVVMTTSASTLVDNTAEQSWTLLAARHMCCKQACASNCHLCIGHKTISDGCILAGRADAVEICHAGLTDRGGTWRRAVPRCGCGWRSAQVRCCRDWTSAAGPDTSHNRYIKVCIPASTLLKGLPRVNINRQGVSAGKSAEVPAGVLAGVSTGVLAGVLAQVHTSIGSYHHVRNLASDTADLYNQQPGSPACS